MEDSVNENQELAGVAAEKLAATEAVDGVAGLAGRELDAAVAERVMGLKVGHLKRDNKQENPFDDYTPYRNNRTGELMSGTMYSEGMAVIGRYSVPRYSSDITAAMKVVEKMRESGFRWDARTPRGTGWQIRCFPADDAPDGYQVFRGLLPEAICRAALQATDDCKTKPVDNESSLQPFTE